MNKEEIKISIINSINLIDNSFEEKEINYLLNKVLNEYEKMDKYTDTFIMVSILSKTFYDCFINNKGKSYDKNTKKIIDLKRFNKNSNIVIPISYNLGLTLIKSPISYEYVNEDNIIKKINEELDFNTYLDDSMYNYYLSKYQTCLYYNEIDVMARYYKDVYNYSLNKKHNKLIEECKDYDEYEIKYGKNSEYYKSKNKIKILGGI